MLFKDREYKNLIFTILLVIPSKFVEGYIWPQEGVRNVFVMIVKVVIMVTTFEKFKTYKSLKM